MATANGIFSKALASGPVIVMARIVDYRGAPIRRSDVSAIEYSVYELDPFWPEQLTVVRGQRAVPLVVADVLFDSLQIGRLWAVDDIGYNFRHELPDGSSSEFAKVGRLYEVAYQVTMNTGRKVNVRFRIGCTEHSGAIHDRH
jgi:hypothetical protein